MTSRCRFVRGWRAAEIERGYDLAVLDDRLYNEYEWGEGIGPRPRVVNADRYANGRLAWSSWSCSRRLSFRELNRKGEARRRAAETPEQREARLSKQREYERRKYQAKRAAYVAAGVYLGGENHPFRETMFPDRARRARAAASALAGGHHHHTAPRAAKSRSEQSSGPFDLDPGRTADGASRLPGAQGNGSVSS